MTLSEGIRVPAWAVGAVVAATVILGVGYAFGSQVGSNSARINRIEDKATGLDFRLCRIERALNIALYQTCSQ